MGLPRGRARALCGFILASVCLGPAVLPFFLSGPAIGDPPFSSNVRINAWAAGTQYAAQIAAGAAGEFLSVWMDTRYNGDIFSARSGDGGRTWSTPSVQVNVDGAPLYDQDSDPDVAFDGSGRVYIAWADGGLVPGGDGFPQIYAANSTDGGLTWSPGVRVSTGTPGWFPPDGPQIAVNGSGTVFMVWEDHRDTTPEPFGDSDVYFARSVDLGVTWTNPNLRLNSGGNPAWRPSVAVSPSGTAVIAWNEAVGTWPDWTFNIFVSQSGDGGVSWTPGIPFPGGGGLNRLYPVVTALDSGDFYIAFTEYAPFQEVRIAHSTDGGRTWTVTPPVWSDVHDGSDADLVAGRDGGLYLTWVDQARHVLLAESRDGGANWSAPQVVSDDAVSNKTWSRVAADASGSVVVVWADMRGGDSDIYSARRGAPAPPNRPPVITNKDAVPRVAVAQKPFAFTFLATDPDGDALTWTKEAGPPWLRLGPGNGTVYGMPHPEDAGPGTFTIRVDDGRGGADHATFTIDVRLAPAPGGTVPAGLPWVGPALVLLAVVLLALFAVWRRKRRRTAPPEA